MMIKKAYLSENMKNVGKISLGTIMGQLISFVTLPIFTRIYGATVIGNWALFNSIAIIVNSFSDLGITNAIMMEENEDSAHNLYKVVSSISLTISIIFGILIYVFKNLFIKDIGLNSYFISTMIIILIFTLQQTQICYTWLNRQKKYNILMKNPILNNISITIIALPLGLLGFETYGYYIAIICGQILTLFNMKRSLPRGLICLDINEYKRVLKKHSNFIIYQMPTNIIMQIKGQLPTILIKLFFNSEILGYYSLCIRMLNMPITFLANSLGKVFFQTVSELKKKGQDVGKFTLRSIEKAMKISLIPIALMLCFGDIAILILFGIDYIISANILRIMAFYGLFLFLSMSTNGIAIVLEKQKYVLISGIFQVIGFSSSIWIGSSIFDSIYISTLGLTISFVIVQIIYFSAIFRSSNIPIIEYIKPLIKEIIMIMIIYILIRGSLLMLGIVKTM